MESIRLEPNYKALFGAFAKDAEGYAKSITRIRDLETLRKIQSLMAALNIAAHATETVEAVIQFRELLDRCTATIATAADKLDNELSGDDEDPTDGKGLL